MTRRRRVAPTVAPRLAGGRRPPDRSLDAYFSDMGRVCLLSPEDEVRLAQALAAGRAAADRLAKHADVTAPERSELEGIAAAGARAREQFVTANLRLVIGVATRYARSSRANLADTIQDGNIGLVQAVDTFDWRRGHRFSTYAVWQIRHAIQHGTASNDRTIRLPYALHDAILRVHAARSRLLTSVGREPTIRELAKATNLQEDLVRRAVHGQHDACSLNRRLGKDPDGAELGGLVAVASDAPAEEVVERLHTAALLNQARALLDDRSWRVLQLRYGLAGDEPMTYHAIGAEVGLCAEWVRRIVKNALVHLRAMLEEPCV